MSSPNSSNLQLASMATSTVTGKYHTPFCGSNCDLVHHDLVAAMFMDARRLSARIKRPGDLPSALSQCIEFTKLSGWDENSDIPDPLDNLRSPLLFLACAFAKTGIVEGLLRNNFNPRVLNQHGESALHFAATHINKAASFGGVQKNMTKSKDREDAFGRILHILTDYHPRILAQKDNNGRTALHVSSTNILNCLRSGKRKRASFHQFCLMSMIKRLLDLEDASIYTRTEIIEVIKTAENNTGDSILHILARDSTCGFHVLKFVQSLLFSGKSMPNEKNLQNETVIHLAWEADPRNAVKIFSLSPTDNNDQQLSQPDSSPHSTQLEETLMSNNDGEASTEVEDTDPMEPETSHSSNLEECTDHATGNPFPQFTIPVFKHASEDDLSVITQSDASVPFIITQAFSLSSEGSLQQIGQTSDSNTKMNDVVIPGKVKLEESCEEVNAASSDADNSFLKFVITEGVGLDVPSKQNIVEVVLKQYSDKLSQVEEKLPKLGQQMSEEETALDQKKKELALLKKEILAKERSLDELRQKKELLCDEKNNLKRKVAHCHATQQQLEDNSKKVRSE